MATHYVTWQDVWARLDERVYNEPEIARLTALAEEAEARFDAELSRQFAVPFEEASNPEAYALAQLVVSKWAASRYIQESQQVQGNEAQVWYSRTLRKDADDELNLFRVRHHPEDAGAPSNPLAFVPQDVSSLSGVTAPDAFFKRARATPGSSEHW